MRLERQKILIMRNKIQTVQLNPQTMYPIRGCNQSNVHLHCADRNESNKTIDRQYNSQAKYTIRVSKLFFPKCAQPHNNGPYILPTSIFTS